MQKATKGAWIVHHSRKIITDISAPSEFPTLDASGKAAEFLMRLSSTDSNTLQKNEIEAVARSINLNPKTELSYFIDLLKNKRLIDTSSSLSEVHILGINTQNVLSNASDILDYLSPNKNELAAIELGEIVSKSPLLFKEASEYISDSFKMSSGEISEFLRRSSEIGFIDQEGDSRENTLLFNGNLFKRDSIKKSKAVLDSLSQNEQSKLNEVIGKINEYGCINVSICEKILGLELLEKIKASGVIEVNTISNEYGEHAFVTLPGAFHKFVDPLVDDVFDMAKALVTALTYGMQQRSSSQGRINNIEKLLTALINGRTIGPATAIGNDYRVLEQQRVIKLTHHQNNMFYMKLLKKEVGQLALNVLSKGNIGQNSAELMIPIASMNLYHGPEFERERTRRKQSKPSKQHTNDILTALRGLKEI